MPLKQPILNAIIHHAYMLHDDEKDALLRAFLEISCMVHREAVEIISPGEDIDGLISARLGTGSSPVATPTPGMVEAEPCLEAVAAPAFRKLAIARHLQSFCHMFRRRESVLQEEEELALFSTIEGVADQVRLEALAWETPGELKGEVSFAKAFGKNCEEPRGTLVETASKRMGVGKPPKGRKPGWPFDAYIELMDEELLIIRRIIEKNRSVSQGYLKAHAM